jgi:hypothetical protein
MANDSELFVTRANLLDRDYRLKGNVFVDNNNYLLPLYEAKMVKQYDHRHGTFEGVPESSIHKTKASTNKPSKKELSSRDYSILPRYWVPKENVNSYFQNHDVQNWLIGFRGVIQPMTNARCSMFSVLPKVAVGHTLLLINSKLSDHSQVLSLLANLNSFVLDFVVRQKIGGSYFGIYILKQVPIIPPKKYSKPLKEYILPRVLELTYNAWDLKSYADDIWMSASQNIKDAIHKQWTNNVQMVEVDENSGNKPEWVNYYQKDESHDSFPYPPFVWDGHRRTQIRTDLDGLYGHLYGLQRDELAYILDTFPIVERKDRAQHGEYRTKRLVLEAYDRLADRADEFGFPEKGPSVLKEGYTPPPSPPPDDEPAREVAEAPPAVDAPPKEKEPEEQAEESAGEEPVALTPEHGFEFYLAVQKALGGEVSISEIYAATARHPEVKTPQGIAEIIAKEHDLSEYK